VWINHGFGCAAKKRQITGVAAIAWEGGSRKAAMRSPPGQEWPPPSIR
jgi:hypothetical protein